MNKIVAKAGLSNLQSTPRKAGLVTDIIRGKGVFEALNLLKFSRKHVARDIAKLLNSAISNAEQAGADIDLLYISSIYVGKDKVLKRFMPRARGRAAKILKYRSKVFIELAERM